MEKRDFIKKTAGILGLSLIFSSEVFALFKGGKSQREIYHAWNTLGMLDGLSKREGKEFSMVLENILNLLIDDSNRLNKKYSNKQFTTHIIPIMYRVYNISKDTDYIRVIKFTNELYNTESFQKLVEDLNGYPSIDVKAEMCGLVTYQYCLKYYNKPF